MSAPSGGIVSAARAAGSEESSAKIEKKGRTIVMKNPVNIALAWEPSILLSWPTNAISAVKFLHADGHALCQFPGQLVAFKELAGFKAVCLSTLEGMNARLWLQAPTKYKN